MDVMTDEKRETKGKPVPVADQSEWRKKMHPRRVRFDDELKAAFLKIYSQTNRVMESLAAVEVNYDTLQKHLENDPIFAQGYEDAKRIYRDKIHRHAERLMMGGVDVPIVGGKNRDRVVANYKNYPYQLLHAELKRVDPGYTDRQEVDHKNTGGVVLIPCDMSANDWIKEQQKLNEKRQKPVDDFGIENQPGS
jgi:hypothetical protein